MRIRDFKWDTSYFNGLDENTMRFAEKLESLDIIKDVYLIQDENNMPKSVIIETDFDCQTSLRKVREGSYKDLMPLAKNRQFKIPYNLTTNLSLRCNKTEELKCNYPTCPIIVAGYLYHEKYMEKKLQLEKEQREKSKEENFKEKQRKKIDKYLNDEIKEKHKDLIEEIFNEIELTTAVKIEFVKLIKTLVNFQDMQDNLDILRPYTNYSFMENTDTIRNICLGQQKCLEYLIKIMNYFKFIDSSEYKVINLKELTEKDRLTDENFKQPIIVITNIYAINEISDSEERYVKFIKSNLPSFILNNSNNNIFVICDKTVNVKTFYQKFPQLKLLFDDVEIADLSEEDVFNILMEKLSKNKTVNPCDNFENLLKDYLHREYMFSAYQNLEFIDYVYKEVMRRLLLTDHPTLLTLAEFPLFRVDDELNFESFNELVGLTNIKKEVSDLYKYLDLQRSKMSRGEKVPDVELHMVYLGNPGTGKTTVARFMGGILFNLGFIRYNKCIECESKDLISDVAGQTAIKTSEKIQEAMGGILFIDEAYAIGENVYGAECIATLIKAMEDYRSDLVVILAGYKIEMQRFLEINSGFKSRIPYTFEFVDYTIPELIQLTLQLFKKYSLEIQGSMVTEKLEEIYTNAKRKDVGFGNGRFVRTTVDKILKQHAINTADSDDEYKRNNLITISDLNFISSL